MPERSTEGDLLTRDTMLMLFLSRDGAHLNISEVAEKLGYADDSSVNRRIHYFESKGLVHKVGLAWELTQEGREKIWPLTLPRYLVATILAVSIGNVYWGIFGLPWQSLVLVSGLIMTALSLIIWYLYRGGEELLLGKASEAEQDGSSDEPVTVTAE
jgi:hypothetical protein